MPGENAARFTGAGILIVWIVGVLVGSLLILVLWSAPDTRLVAFLALLISWGIVLRIAVALNGMRVDSRLRAR